MQCGLAGVLGTWGLLVKSRKERDSVLMYKGKIRLRLYSTAEEEKSEQGRGMAASCIRL